MSPPLLLLLVRRLQITLSLQVLLGLPQARSPQPRTQKVSDAAESVLLKSYIQEHFDSTQSTVANDLLETWDSSVSKFVKVMPYDYKKVSIEMVKDNKSLPEIGKPRQFA